MQKEIVHDFSPGEDRYDLQMMFSSEDSYYIIRVEFDEGSVETREFSTSLFTLNYATKYAKKDTLEIRLTPYDRKCNDIEITHSAVISIYKDGEVIVIINYEKFDLNYQTRNTVNILSDVVKLSSDFVEVENKLRE